MAAGLVERERGSRAGREGVVLQMRDATKTYRTGSGAHREALRGVSLDISTGSQVLSVLRRAHDELGQTTVVVTHDAKVAAAGDEVILLTDGHLERRLRLADTGPRSAPGHRGRSVLRWLERPDPRASAG